MKRNTSKPSIHLTFDVEENPPIKKKSVHTDDCLFSNKGCSILITLLQECQVRATFFVTGHFAEKNPNIVKKLYEKGHEIANHSYNHEDFKIHNFDKLESEIKKSTEILSNLIGEKIKGFRAPFCRYRKDLSSLLKAYDYEYDSSLHPTMVPGRYYNLFSPLSPFQEKSGIWEIPISVIPLIHFPISWWWMRNLGSWITYIGTTINLHSQRNVVLYFHPWEFIDAPQMGVQKSLMMRNTGKRFCRELKNFIQFYKNKNIDFVPIKEKIPRSS